VTIVGQTKRKKKGRAVFTSYYCPPFKIFLFLFKIFPIAMTTLEKGNINIAAPKPPVTPKRFVKFKNV